LAFMMAPVVTVSGLWFRLLSSCVRQLRTDEVCPPGVTELDEYRPIVIDVQDVRSARLGQ
jgi:hypothetical protein